MTPDPGRLRTAQLSKSIQYGCSNVQLVNLALKGAGHHAFTQPLDAVHLRFHQTSPVVANPAFPDTSPQAPARSNSCIAVLKNSSPAHSCILAWRNDGDSTVLDDRFVGGLCIVSTITSQTFECFIWRQLLQQVAEHRGIADVIARHTDCPNLQGVCIDAYVQLAPLAAIFSTVLFAFPLAFAQELDTC